MSDGTDFAYYRPFQLNRKIKGEGKGNSFIRKETLKEPSYKEDRN